MGVGPTASKMSTGMGEMCMCMPVCIIVVCVLSPSSLTDFLLVVCFLFTCCCCFFFLTYDSLGHPNKHINETTRLNTLLYPTEIIYYFSDYVIGLFQGYNCLGLISHSLFNRVFEEKK